MNEQFHSDAPFHEAAHAVVAIELMMLGVVVRLRPETSVRGINTDGHIDFGCPIISGEPIWRTIQRRLAVILAGPEWEKFSSRHSLTRKDALKRQWDDCLAAMEMVNRLRAECKLHGRSLRRCIETAWDETEIIIKKRNSQLLNIAEALRMHGELDDSQIRWLFAEASINQAAGFQGRNNSDTVNPG